MPATTNEATGVLDCTVIIPAYNEAESIADTVRSIQAQTLPPREIIVIDDFSSDDTGAIARSLGVSVVRPPQNTGSKAGAQNFALTSIRTTFCMAIDADTTLAPDAIGKLASAFTDANIVAACGFVLPRTVQTMWERGRYVEYLFAFTFYKPIQDYFGKPMISSGCFSMYRTHLLQELGGWPTRTMAEDMDLTWTFYEQGLGVRFIPDALCYPIEPHNYRFMKKQLTRWSHGFVQNVRLHWRGIARVPFLRSAVAVATWDALVASVLFLFALPIVAIVTGEPLILLGYIIDAPAVAVPVIIAGRRRHELLRSLASLPAFFALRIFNAAFMVLAWWQEVVVGKRLNVYEKGH